MATLILLGLATATILLIILCVLAISWVLRRTITAMLPGRAAVGVSRASALIALGMTAVVFDETITLAIRLSLELALAATTYLFQALERTAAPSSTDLSTFIVDGELVFVPEKEPLEIAVGALSDVGAPFGRATFFVNDFPYAMSIAAIGFYTFVSTALGPARNDGTASGDGRWHVGSWLRSLGPVAQQRLVTAIAVAGGAYLILASIIAVPWLGELRVGTLEDREAFAQRVASVTLGEAEWAQEFESDTFSRDPFGSLRSDELAARLSPASRARLKQDLTTADAIAARVRSGWRTQITRAKGQRAQLQRNALETFQAYYKRSLSQREREIFADQVLDRPRERMFELEGRCVLCAKQSRTGSRPRSAALLARSQRYRRMASQ